MKAVRTNRIKKILVWGAGGHAKVVMDILRNNRVKVVGVIDDENPGRAGEMFCGAKVFANIEWFVTNGPHSIIIAIGDNSARARIARFVTAKGFQLAAAVHPCAVIAPDVELGAGTVVMAGAVVNCGTLVGENVIINTLASVDHDCLIGNAVHVSPGGRIAGHVKVGRLSWIGIGATIIDDVEIGEKAMIGAGSVVIRDVSAGTVVAGVPARTIGVPAK